MNSLCSTTTKRRAMPALLHRASGKRGKSPGNSRALRVIIVPALALAALGISCAGPKGRPPTGAEKPAPAAVAETKPGNVEPPAVPKRTALPDPDPVWRPRMVGPPVRPTLGSPDATGRTWVVNAAHAAASDDGAGTDGAPFRTINAAAARAMPGDRVLVHAGTYREHVRPARGGEPGRPIVWRGAGDGEAVIDGMGAERAVSATDVHDVFFEGLSIRNSQFALVAHGSSEMVVRRCHFHGNTMGFVGTDNTTRMRNFYVADNLFEGPATWPRTKGIEAARAVQVCGEGHVVCYNRVRGFGDGIDIMWDTPNRAIDFYGNDVSECTDDAFELDYGVTNVRCFRNRITNCFEGVSAQPVYGGPAYIMRNAMYNLEYSAFKLHNRTMGVVLLHNTSVKAGSPWVLHTPEQVTHVVSRNNLFVGTEAPYGMEFSPPMVACDFDYDGFAGGPFARFARWHGNTYQTWEEFRRESGIEAHGVLLGVSPFGEAVRTPQDHREQFSLAANDLRLRAGTSALDAGLRLPNINDACRGEAPDLGAYEQGSPLPHYGPRGEWAAPAKEAGRPAA